MTLEGKENSFYKGVELELRGANSESNGANSRVLLRNRAKPLDWRSNLNSSILYFVKMPYTGNAFQCFKCYLCCEEIVLFRWELQENITRNG